jgi:hypothetical protein
MRPPIPVVEACLSVGIANWRNISCDTAEMSLPVSMSPFPAIGEGLRPLGHCCTKIDIQIDQNVQSEPSADDGKG